MNPLESIETFTFSGLNPNPSFSKTKEGPVYRVSFEIDHDVWLQFVDANTKGMIIDFAGQVQESHQEKPKGGKISKNAGMLCDDDMVNKWAQDQGFTDFKDMIYVDCHIKSRAELDHNLEAAETYSKLKSRFIRDMNE